LTADTSFFGGELGEHRECFLAGLSVLRLPRLFYGSSSSRLPKLRVLVKAGHREFGYAIDFMQRPTARSWLLMYTTFRVLGVCVCVFSCVCVCVCVLLCVCVCVC
jgi:hypothetical protein